MQSIVTRNLGGTGVRVESRKMHGAPAKSCFLVQVWLKIRP